MSSDAQGRSATQQSDVGAVDVAEALGYAGDDKSKAASLAFLGDDCDPAEVDAAREALGY